MAFGFSPKYLQEKIIEELTQEQLLALSVETIKFFNWNISFISSNEIISYTSTSIFLNNKEISITINNNTISIKSECTGFELFDMGRNKKNTFRFFNILEYLKEKTSVEQLNEKYNPDVIIIMLGANDDPCYAYPQKVYELFRINI